MSHTATVTKSGQIGIPKAMLQELGIHKGDKIELVSIRGGIKLLNKNNNLNLGVNIPNTGISKSLSDLDEALLNRDI